MFSRTLRRGKTKKQSHIYAHTKKGFLKWLHRSKKAYNKLIEKENSQTSVYKTVKIKRFELNLCNYSYPSKKAIQTQKLQHKTN